MKNKLKILVAVMLIAAPLLMFAQGPPHPNNGGAPGSGNGPVGGSPPSGAPVGNGVSILLAFAAGYGAMKLYQIRRAHQPTE